MFGFAQFSTKIPGALEVDSVIFALEVAGGRIHRVTMLVRLKSVQG